MVCWEVNLVNVEFQVKHVDLLKLAITNLGYNYFEIRDGLSIGRTTINFSTGKAITDNQNFLNQLKVQYSKEAIKKVAKKKKWILKKINSQKYQAKKY